jgi:hypothetical protein
MDKNRQGEIALALLRHIAAGPEDGPNFMAYEGTEASYLYFEGPGDVGRTELHSFGNASSMPPGLAHEIDEDRLPVIACSVTKFEMAFNPRLALHERSEAELDAIAKGIDVDPAEFRAFVAEMHRQVLDEIAGLMPVQA